jgi:NDP-sugar pyrophosphorylase family protein
MKAVILAGGEGTRMRPYTYVVPKPLLPVNNRPILEHVIKNLNKHGINDLIISIGYLGYQIKNYFGDGSGFGTNIEYVEEERPLGTAGCLNLLRDKLKETFLLYGGDNLTNLDIKDFIRFHKEKGGILTVALFEFNEKTKWGIYNLNSDSSIKEFLEKPTFTHNAGTMIFCVEPRIFDYIPQDKGVVNITDHIIPKLLEKGERIFGYPFKGEWIDIGSIDDYENANSRQRNFKNLGFN